MLIADTVVRSSDGVNTQFSVFSGDRNQFASRKFFRSAALVGVNMGGAGADHRMKGISQSFKTETIRCRTVEYDEHVNISAEMLLKSTDCGFRVRVIPISHCMSLI